MLSVFLLLLTEISHPIQVLPSELLSVYRSLLWTHKCGACNYRECQSTKTNMDSSDNTDITHYLIALCVVCFTTYSVIVGLDCFYTILMFKTIKYDFLVLIVVDV